MVLYTSVEVVAIVLSVLVLIKVLFLFTAPKPWFNLTKPLFSYPKIVSWLAFILSLVVLSFLLREITITQIFVSGMFLFLLFIAGMHLFNKELVTFRESLINNLRTRDYWWYLVLWVIIAVWVLEEVLTK
ncbi:MAG: hypothetical protein AABW73_01950 [Nanoarchaeota archaeon]